MEALYGYMTESELENSIMEKEFDIKMKRLFLESEYMVETEDISKKQNVFQKMIESIQKFIQKILDSMSDFMDKMKEKKMESKLKDAPPVKMDYDPRKRLNEIEKSTNSILNKLKHPGLIKKDETGTHLTSRGKKVAAGAGITIGVAVLFDVYRRINKLQKDTSNKLNDLLQKLNNHKTYDEIAIHDAAWDLQKNIDKVSKESGDIKDQISELQENIKEANKLRQDLERNLEIEINGTRSYINSRFSNLDRNIADDIIDDVIPVIKRKYPGLDSMQLRYIRKLVDEQVNKGEYNKKTILSIADRHAKKFLKPESK